MDKIAEIASTHLGSKQGDYSNCNYSSPDSSLLVSIPRSLNRDELKINPSRSMAGLDTWRGYEVSVLNNRGYPINFIAVIQIDASTPNIIESKSMKLYWNSFNFYKAGRTYKEVLDTVLTLSTAAIRLAVGNQNAWVKLYRADQNPFTTSLFDDFTNVDDIIEKHGDYLDMVSTQVYSPDYLDENGDTTTKIAWTGLRSNCRVTKQPDFGTVYISVNVPFGQYSPSPVSLARYVSSLRSEMGFHEDTVEKIFAELTKKYSNASVSVWAYYTRRGGWDICPYRTTEGWAAQAWALHRTSRQ